MNLIRILFVFLSLSISYTTLSAVSIDTLQLTSDNISGMNSEELLQKSTQLFNDGLYQEFLELSDYAIEVCETEGNIAGVSDLVYKKGISNRLQGDYVKALELLYLSLDLYKVFNNKLGEANVLNQIGTIYRLQGNNPGALEYFLSSLSIFESANDKHGKAKTLNNIGIVYFYQKNFENALKYYKASMEIEMEIGNEYGISISYINIGEVYKNIGNYQQALDFFLKALVLAKKSEDKDKEQDSEGILYNEIGSIYLNLGDLTLSTGYLNKALDIFVKIDNKQRIAECKLYLGQLALKQNNVNQAHKLFNQALQNAEIIKSVDIISQANQKLSSVYEKLNNTPKAYYHFKKHIAFRDSLFNAENTKQMVQSEMLYQFEKQIQATKFDQAKRDVIAQEMIQRQRLIRNFLAALLTLFLAVIVAVYKAYKGKKEANIRLYAQQQQILEKNEELLQQQEEILSQRDEIEKKNQILEETQKIVETKNERIISSIEYAQTIQQAILPNKEHLNEFFPEHMVVYLPKDIVSGDFYWFSAIDNLLFAAVVDCTGHGVPGAFMSLIGNTLLNKIVNEWQTRDPGLILELMHKQVRKALNQDISTTKAHASMDVCIVSIDINKRQGVFAGASRPLYFIQNGELERIPGDPRSVGGFQREEHRYYTNHILDLRETTNIYLTTDGYMDQMNDTFKKYGQRNFAKTLLSIHNQPQSIQSNFLISTYEKHRQNQEQIDDICILGLKL